MIDTHSHIYDEAFDKDIDEVIARAKEAGVSHVVLPNVDSETLQPMLSLEEKDPSFFHAAIGVHPTSVKADYEKELALVKSELDRRKYIAIGEIGIDLYWDKTFLKEQVIVFEQQLQWAIEYDLPVIIHVRDAFAETFEVVERNNCDKLRGIFHSFTGTQEDAQRILDLKGFKLGINGVLTFKNSDLSNVLQKVPLNELVLETDAPYLTPVPYRGKRNEPSYLQYVIAKLSEVYGVSENEVIKKTDENSLEILKILTL